MLNFQFLQLNSESATLFLSIQEKMIWTLPGKEWVGDLFNHGIYDEHIKIKSGK